MTFIFSRRFFIIATLGVIIFLTGCARGSYHSPAISSGPLPAGSRWSEASVAQHFVWPLKGEIILPFGAKEDHVSLKGIVIRARAGEAVVAARDGRVRLIDQKLRGYGKTIILEHPSGFYTIYARNSEVLVTLGEWVRQGQPIARVDCPARAKFAQLYFEIRKNTKVEDPLLYLQRN